MKKVFLAICMFIATTAWATGLAKIGEAEFGKSYQEIVPLLENEFGIPISVTSEQVVYEHKNYQGVNFDKIVFNFRNSKFAEARFYIKTSSKATANNTVKELVKKFTNAETVFCDFDDGSYFYKDGRAPVGSGRLFTISSLRLQGEWNAEVRYGPFKY